MLGSHISIIASQFSSSNSNFEPRNILLVNSLITIIIATFTSLLAVPTVNHFAKRKELFDTPNKRKQKTFKIVRIGGIGIFIGYLISIMVMFLVDPNINNHLLSLMLLGGSCFFVIGLIDDLRPISPYTRLFFQFFISILIWSNGFKLDVIDLAWLGFDDHIIHLPALLSLIITSFWITAVINAINWMDGLDGLSAGITLITCLNLFVIAFSYNNSSIFYFIAALLGVSVGFLKYNIYPSKILMGDCGSYFLGYNLAILSLLATDSSDGNINIIFSFLILLVPLLDMAFVIFSRILKGHSPYKPDRSHLHHRLLKAGFSHKNAVIAIIFFSQIIYTVLLFVVL